MLRNELNIGNGKEKNPCRYLSKVSHLNAPNRSRSVLEMRDFRSLKVSQKISTEKAKKQSLLNQQQIEGDFGLFEAILHRKKAWNI